MQDFIRYKSSKVYFSSYGKGASVVLLHGFLENASMWNFVIDELKKRNQVITIDLLGHGKTTCLGSIHTMEEMAAVVRAVLLHLEVQEALFIGHSMGGYVSLAFAEKYPKCIKGLCLLNSTAQADTRDRKKLRDRANMIAKTNYESLVRMSVANQFTKESTAKFREEIAAAKRQALQTTLQGYTATNEGMKIRKDRTHILASVRFKKLLIVGKNDPVLHPVSVIEEAKKTKTQWIELPDGHMSHIENTEKVKKILNVFVT